ncbi:disease resistance protein RUN1-like isoform X3 [Prosopis cineraria]|uniref:disease resistance protein RUN1-like isoform X3 n=1 Tax=Prosopis cineraria TaxID=364024 RepID=UPI00240F2179|nr:disease resistance protein RUN1-like isoform X3 [Prosopis cineraria]
MANTTLGESSSTSGAPNSTPIGKYDVFLSFRGEDTRLKFTDHLYHALTRSGLKAFRDDEKLQKGEVLSPQLIQAIKDSLCAVVVLSQNYADSKWCLIELQQILETMNNMGRRVFPIFYDVDPSDVRNQRKRFGEALANHEERLRGEGDTTTVQIWKNSLSEIGNMSGWDTRNRPEVRLIEEMVGEVWKYLWSKLPSYDDNLVGTERRMVDLMSCLEIELDDIHSVGIWGMGGSGKTTLAKVVYEKISERFEMCSFLANVRETLQTKGLVSLQKSLLSQIGIKEKIYDEYEGMKMIKKLFRNKKVLLVLDDLDDENPLEKLAGGLDWFGKGSRIIITTRNSHVVTSFEGKLYEMKAMKEDEALQLFSKKAFKKDHPKGDYLELSKAVVAYAGGLPLALEVLGSFLYKRSIDGWIDTLNKLKQNPNTNIFKTLKISFDGLDEKEKTIFLDIACFFRGWRKDKVTLLLDGCDLNPIIGIEVLIEKTLLVERKYYSEDLYLDMHDLLEELAKDIIRQESPNPGSRSRLWEFEDFKEVLENNNGSKAIEAVCMRHILLDPGNEHKIEVHPKAFSKMNNIRLLIIDGLFHELILPRELELPSALKVVCWPQFSLEALPFPFIKQLWNGRQAQVIAMASTTVDSIKCSWL